MPIFRMPSGITPVARSRRMRIDAITAPAAVPIATTPVAAYSSNLFGITCVALVKIRHVRPFKRQLILEGQAAIARPAS